MSLLSHDRYQYDSLILSKQTWAYPCQHLQQLLWCFVSARLNLPEVEERKLCLWYTPIRRNHKELSLDLLHNVENIYFFYSNPVLKRVEHLHSQINIVSNATQKLGFERTYIANPYLSFIDYTIHSYLWSKKLHFTFLFLISNSSCLIRSYKWTFCNIFPHQKLCCRGSFLLTSLTVRTVQDCLLYLLLRIYCVSANWSSRLRNHFAPVCLQSNHTPGSASGDGLKNRLSASYRNKRPSKWRYTIWSHVYPPTHPPTHLSILSPGTLMWKEFRLGKTRVD